MSTVDATPRYDPYDVAIDADPYPVWKRLRDEAPLYYNEQYDFYALSRFADVLAASLEWQTYSSARGTVLELIDTSTPVADAPDSDASLGMMIFMDPPRHDELRTLVSRSFTPRRISALEDRIRELSVEFLDPQRDGSGFDYLDEYAAKIPTMLIGTLLGVPSADQDQLRKWIDVMMRFEPDGVSAEKADAGGRLGEYIEALVDERRRTPREDMVSDLLAAEITRADGTSRGLDHREVMAFFTLLNSPAARRPRACSDGRPCSWRATPTSGPCWPRTPVSFPMPSKSSYVTSRRPRSRPASSLALSNGTVRSCPRSRRSRCSPGAPDATSANTPNPIDSTSPATSTATSRSGSVCTTASAPTWLGSKRGSRSRRR